VKTIPADRGKANTPATAGVPALHARGVTCLMRTGRRGCRIASRQTLTKKAGVISARGWKRPFEDPIPLPRGRQLVTLQDAADFILKLPKAEQNLEEWQAATEGLIMAAETRGPSMHARIGVLRALNRNVERVFNPDRKDTHWGKRKLKRDE
jgi:hypothetical protein